MRLKGKVAIVTGSGRGIGRAIALRFAAEGAKVTVNDLDPQSCALVVDEIEAAGGQAFCVTADVSQEPGVRELVAAAIRRFGRIDILVNNAGVIHNKALTEIRAEEWDRVMAVNLRSMFLCCREVFPHMRRQGSGSILNMSSVAGKRGGGLFGTTAYAASKGGVIAFTKALAREGGPHGVRANALSPAFIETQMTETLTAEMRQRVIRETPLGRAGRPEEVAAAACFLVSDEASFTTGEIMDVDGGVVMD